MNSQLLRTPGTFGLLRKYLSLQQAITLLLLGLMTTQTVFAGAGELDATFGDGGLVTTDIGRNTNSAVYRKVFPQGDGKFIVAVMSDRLKLSRFNANGVIDLSYGVDGSVILPALLLPENETHFVDIDMQSSGKIILTGYARTLSGFDCTFNVCRDVYTNAYFVSRLNADGTMDVAFGTDGMVVIDFQGYFGSESTDTVSEIVVQEDNKIIAVVVSLVPAGGPRNRYTHLIRFTEHGVIDATYGLEGLVEFSHTTGRRKQIARRIRLQSDGKLLVHLYDESAGTYLVRYSVDGWLDQGFGLDGKASATSISSFAARRDGKIIIARGATQYDPVYTCGFGITQLNSDGTQDLEFGNAGQSIVDFGCASSPSIYATPSTISFDENDKIVVGGDVFWQDPSFARRNRAGIARLHLDGSLDETFGVAGTFVADFEEGALSLRELIIQPSGQILVLGDLKSDEFGNDLYGFGRFYSNPIVLAYGPTGDLDMAFGDAGQIILPAYWSSDDEAMDVVALQGDGKILVAGTSSTRYRGDFALVRYQENGELDPSFGTGGKVTTDFTLLHPQACDWVIHSDDELFAIALQPDGKIIAVGRSLHGNDYGTWCENLRYRIAVARYLPDGTLDESFGSDGRMLVFGDSSESSFNSQGMNVEIQQDGRILIAGLGGGYLLVRLNSDGNLDPTFGIGGYTKFDPAAGIPGISYFEKLTALALQVDGKILATGSFLVTWPPWSQITSRCNLIRFNQDGSVDATFGPSGGGLINVFYDSSLCSDVAVQPDGQILVVGSTNTVGEIGRTSLTQFSVHRFSPNGIRDLTFGVHGVSETDFDLSLRGALGGDRATSIALQADGRIVVGGYVTNWYLTADDQLHANKDFALVRLNTDGSHDYSFGQAGKVVTDFGSLLDFGHALAIQADGKLVLVGSSSQNFKGVGEEIAIARYEGVTTKLDELEGLINRVQELQEGGVLSDGRARSLLAKLQAAVQQIDQGKFEPAVNQMGAFINHVDAFVTAGALTMTQGGLLNLEAQRIIGFFEEP